MNANATEAQVNRALELRAEPVRAVTVSSASGNKLLLIENSDQSQRLNRAALANDAIFRKWEKTFRELA